LIDERQEVTRGVGRGAIPGPPGAAAQWPQPAAARALGVHVQALKVAYT
jgi:hypothetical protein